MESKRALDIQELMKRVYCMDSNDIKQALGDQHSLDKFKDYIEEYGSHGKFNFIFSLDGSNVTAMLDHLENKYEGKDETTV